MSKERAAPQPPGPSEHHEQLARVIEKIAKEQPNTVMIRCPLCDKVM